MGHADDIVLFQQVAVDIVAYLAGKVKEGTSLGVGGILDVRVCTAILTVLDEDVDDIPLLDETAYTETFGTGTFSELGHGALLHIGTFVALREGDVGLGNNDWF